MVVRIVVFVGVMMFYLMLFRIMIGIRRVKKLFMKVLLCFCIVVCGNVCILFCWLMIVYVIMREIFIIRLGMMFVRNSCEIEMLVVMLKMMKLMEGGIIGVIMLFVVMSFVVCGIL